MGEATPMIEVGSKVLEIMTAVGVDTAELKRLGLEPNAPVYVGFLDTLPIPKQEGETRKLYGKLKDLLQEKSNQENRVIIYRFGTSNTKLLSLAVSPEFNAVFGNWDARNVSQNQQFFYKQFRPQTTSGTQ